MPVTAPGQISLSTASKRAPLQSVLEWLRTQSDPDTGVINSPYVNLIRDSADAVDLQIKEVDIGDWNMNSTAVVSVTHGLTLAKIVAVVGYVRDDADAVRSNLPSFSTAGAVEIGFRVEPNAIVAATIDVFRIAGTGYDSTSYNATSYSRGSLYVLHTP